MLADHTMPAARRAAGTGTLFRVRWPREDSGVVEEGMMTARGPRLLGTHRPDAAGPIPKRALIPIDGPFSAPYCALKL